MGPKLAGSILLVLLATAGTAVAAPVEGTIDGAGTVWMQGPVRANIVAAGAFSETGQAATWTLDGSEISVETWNLPLEELRINSGGSVYRSHRALEPERLATTTSNSVDLHLSSNASSYALRILPVPGDDDILLQWESRSAEFGSVGQFMVLDEDQATAFAADVEGQTLRPSADHSLTSATLSSTLSLPRASILLIDGRASLADGTRFTAGQLANMTRSAVDPITGSGRVIYDTKIMVLRGDDLQLHPHEGVSLTIAAQTVEGAMEGSIGWSGLDARLHIDSKPLEGKNGLLQLEGTFSFAADLRQQPGHWTIQGDAINVRVDGKPWEAAVELAVVSATGLALLVAVLSRWFGAGLGAVVGEARMLVGVADPMKNGTRQSILKIIHEHQPVPRKAIADQLGMSLTNVTYHLRILTRTGILQESAEGDGSRNNTFMLNSGSLKFRMPGTPEEAVPVDRTLSTIHTHPIRKATFEILRERGPMDYATLMSALDERGLGKNIPQSSMTYHLQLLAKVGAIRSTRDGRRKNYEAILDTEQARILQYRSFLILHGLMPVAKLLAEKGELDPELVQAESIRPRELRKLLAKLERLGIAEAHGNTFRLASHLAPHASLLGGNPI